jgi:sulfate transport system permease protein
MNTRPSRLVPRLATAVALLFLLLFLGLPLAMVFAGGFRQGVAHYCAAIGDPVARAAIRLTLLTAAVAVPLNLLFGLAAGWAIGKFRFRGRGLLITLMDLPFSVPPVVAGMIHVILFGLPGRLGPWLAARGLPVIFAAPGIVLATLFVTLPVVARELIPLMEAQGTEEEEAAITLGAGGLRMLWHVTLPNARQGLLHGVILCNARAMGEFGAVSVVSGRIRGLTCTMTLHVENLYNEYQSAAAFAVASLLGLLALATLAAKAIMDGEEHHGHRDT